VPSDRYVEVTDQLQRIYGEAVERRAKSALEPWKIPERAAFLELLEREGRRSLLEIGAGTGVHGRFFADAGLEVVCTDLSEAMVEHCRTQGIVAVQQDFLHLDLGRRFDAVFAMNCLLHVPREDLPAVLASIRSTLVDGGVFFLGQYGGIDHDGVFADDDYEPKRYFSLLPDDDLLAVAREHFEVEMFHAVEIDSDDGDHFQSLVLRA
jgi:SAM-dependent methyltransferase